MNPIWSFLAELVSPITKLIDDVHTSEEEKLQIKAAMFKIQQDITTKVIDYESQLMENQSKIILAEAQGEGWLQKNWRPLMMVWFASLLGMYWFGFTPTNLAQETINQLFTLLQIGIGGYIVGRSGEKIIPQVVEALKKDK
ncbi:holin [Caudoviricetes sp.]|nr:holin [Caudoviricetes sp.]